MHNRVLRRFPASLLVVSMWMGAVIVLPSSGVSQTVVKADPATDTKADKKDAKPAATPAPTNSSPLSTNEDPAQIGRRNINGGTDKFFGWLGGSKEKEMQI